MRCLKCLFKGFFQPNVWPQSHLCLPWRLFPLRFTIDDRQYGHHFFSHNRTPLLNSFNNYIHKMISLNSLTTILAILFGHYSHPENRRRRGEESHPDNFLKFLDSSPAFSGVRMIRWRPIGFSTIPKGEHSINFVNNY